MNSHLFAHNILFMSGGILNVLLAIAILIVRRRNIDNLVVTFILMTLSVSVFQISQVLGANAATAEISREIFMWNLCVIPIQVFMTHWFLALLGKTKEQRTALALVYLSGAVLLAISIIFPDTYLLPSVPKMYLPFYYEPGDLQWITRAWFHIVGAYYFIIMLRAYHFETDPIRRNRYLYVMLAVLYGFLVGETAVLLVYDIQFDPMWSSFFGAYTFLIAYAIVRYQLLDVRVIIRRAAVYAIFVSILISLISFSNSFNVLMQINYPGFPDWIVPVISSFMGVAVGLFIWNKFRENDHLKYEFITIIAHKFRTPLTTIKWSAEELSKDERDEQKRTSLDAISVSTEKLVSLTGTLMDMANADNSLEAVYQFKHELVGALVSEVKNAYERMAASKDITILYTPPVEEIRANIDRDKFKFIIQTLLENAIEYSPTGGKVTIKVVDVGRKVMISVTDNGMGISKSDKHFLFSRFYRSASAKLKDTEGFGVGLFLAQSIASRHGGRIDVHSDGEGKGSTFTVIIPIAK